MSPLKGSRGVVTPGILERLRANQAVAKMVGEAPVFLKFIAQLPTLASADVPVLITGETGCGKELAARAIHYLGARASFPFVAVNCGAVPDTLLEDELFGHESGAFTDARVRRTGLVSQAEKGTVFLDEADSLSPRAQVVLLRIIQDKMLRTLGSTIERRVDVRFVAATKVPLSALVARGSFRSDLFYRLSVLTVSLPPLRDRRQDIPMLARHFLLKHARRDAPTQRLAADAEAALCAFDWPGNVRELENAIIRGINLSDTDSIETADLELTSAATDAVDLAGGAALPLFKDAKRAVIDAFQKAYLTRLMREHDGNVTRAAHTAGKDRRELGKLLKKYDLAASEPRA